MKSGFTGLYLCKHTNYYHAFRLYHVLFSTKQEHYTEQLLAVDPSYCASYSLWSNYTNLLTQHGLTTRFANLADIPGLHNITTG